MPREIWNEGRVTGMSAYETYIKQHLSEDPDTPPATEREWLASSLAMGSSMLLKVPTSASSGYSSSSDSFHYYIDIPMPTNSKLCAANTIIAQFFDGDAVFDSTGYWAIRISDYGSCIKNTSENHPSGTYNAGQVSNISQPLGHPLDWDDAKKTKLHDYMRILDGIVLQPGTWVNSTNKPPEMDFQANITRPYPTVRLHVRGKITTNPLVLLTGFTIKTVLSGTIGVDSSTDTNAPQDGDFLGPATFPWASKIIFHVPTYYGAYLSQGSYNRSLDPTESVPYTLTVKDAPLIDMQASKPETYYNNYVPTYSSKYPSSDSMITKTVHVNSYTTSGMDKQDLAVLTVYQRSTSFPPALYGTFVSNIDETPADQHMLCPLDSVAPGAVKMFKNVTEADLKNYESTFTGTTALNRLSNGTIQILTPPDGTTKAMVYVANTETRYLNSYLGVPSQVYWSDKFTFPDASNYQVGGQQPGILTGADRPMLTEITTGTKSQYVLRFGDATTPMQIQKTPENDIRIVSGQPDARPHSYRRKGSGPTGTQLNQPTGLPSVEAYLNNESDPTKVGPETGRSWMSRKAIQLRTEFEEQGANLYTPDVVEDPANSGNYVLLPTADPASYNNLNWATLLAALKENRSIDILGNRLKSMKFSLTRPHNSGGTAPFLEFGPTVDKYIEDASDPNVSPATLTADKIVRLYITTVTPSTEHVPEGSIGIGWGLDS